MARPHDSEKYDTSTPGGAIGFVSVLWSGTLWALAYERTRSLLPAIFGHVFNNLFVSAEFLWLLRM